MATFRFPFPSYVNESASVPDADSSRLFVGPEVSRERALFGIAALMSTTAGQRTIKGKACCRIITYLQAPQIERVNTACSFRLTKWLEPRRKLA